MLSKRKRNTHEEESKSPANSIFNPIIKRSRITRSTYGSAAELPIVLDSESDSDSQSDSTSNLENETDITTDSEIIRSRNTRSTRNKNTNIYKNTDISIDSDNDALLSGRKKSRPNTPKKSSNINSTVTPPSSASSNISTSLNSTKKSLKKDILNPLHLDKAILNLAVKNSLKDIKLNNEKNLVTNDKEEEKIMNDKTLEKIKELEKLEKLKNEKVGKVEKVKEVEKVEKAEKAEKTEKAEKVEKVEEVVEKAENVEQVEKVEKIEKVVDTSKVDKGEEVAKTIPNKESEVVKSPKKQQHPNSLANLTQNKAKSNLANDNTIKDTKDIKDIKESNKADEHNLETNSPTTPTNPITQNDKLATNNNSIAEIQTVKLKISRNKLKNPDKYETQKSIEKLISSRLQKSAKNYHDSNPELNTSIPISTLKLNFDKRDKRLQSLKTSSIDKIHNKIDKIDKHEKFDKIDKIGKIGKIGKIDKIEKPVVFDPTTHKSYKDIYSTSCISCTKKGRGDYCNRQQPCDICVGKRLRKCYYPPDAEIVIHGVLKKSLRNNNRQDNFIDKNLKNNNSSTSKNDKENNMDRIVRLNLRLGKDPKKVKSNKRFEESETEEESDSSSSDDSEDNKNNADSEDNETEEFSSDDDGYYYDHPTRNGKKYRYKYSSRKSSSPRDNFEKAQKLLKELEFEKRDVDVYSEGKRRRAATRGNYFIPSDPDNDSDDDGYAAAEARNEQIILSEDEEERRMLRGELDMEYVNNLRRERDKKVKPIEASDESSGEDDMFFG